jgi:hypothetical protein
MNFSSYYFSSQETSKDLWKLLFEMESYLPSTTYLFTSFILAIFSSIQYQNCKFSYFIAEITGKKTHMYMYYLSDNYLSEWLVHLFTCWFMWKVKYDIFKPLIRNYKKLNPKRQIVITTSWNVYMTNLLVADVVQKKDFTFKYLYYYVVVLLLKHFERYKYIIISIYLES